MPEVSFSNAGSIGLTVLGFIKITQPTFIGTFLMWMPFGWGWFQVPLNFIYDYFPYIGAVFFMLIFMKWTRNIYILGALALLFALFVRFVLYPIGG